MRVSSLPPRMYPELRRSSFEVINTYNNESMTPSHPSLAVLLRLCETIPFTIAETNSASVANGSLQCYDILLLFFFLCFFFMCVRLSSGYQYKPTMANRELVVFCFSPEAGARFTTNVCV